MALPRILARSRGVGRNDLLSDRVHCLCADCAGYLWNSSCSDRAGPEPQGGQPPEVKQCRVPPTTKPMYGILARSTLNAER
jgi:hypothetical protein